VRVNDPNELNAHGLHSDRNCIFQEVASWDQEEQLTLELDRRYVREGILTAAMSMGSYSRRLGLSLTRTFDILTLSCAPSRSV